MIAVNGCDKENADFIKVITRLEELYGNSIVAVQIPIIENHEFTGYLDILENKVYTFAKDGLDEIEVPANMKDIYENYRKKLIEAAAESDDELMEKYFDGQDLTQEEMIKGLKVGYLAGTVSPVCCTSSTQNKLVIKLLENIIFYSPSPDEAKPVIAFDVKTGDEIEIKIDEKAKTVVQVFKTIADPFVGKLSYVKVLSGTLSNNSTLVNVNSEKQEKMNALYQILGKKQIAVETIYAGDIGAIAKLTNTNTSDTLCDQSYQVKIPPIEFPKPVVSMAVYAKKQGDEDKIFGSLAKIASEDKTILLSKDTETGETILSGIGEQHLEVVMKKLANKFNVNAAR